MKKIFLASFLLFGLTLFFPVFESRLVAQEQTAASSVAPAAQDAPKQDGATVAKLKEAAEKFQKNDLEGALEILKALSASNPTVLPPRIYLARWFAQIKNERAALVSLEKATEESPADPEAYILLAGLSFTRGELTAAELLMDKAEVLLAAYKADSKRQKVLASKLLNDKYRLYSVRNNWEKAQAVLGQIQTVDKDSPELSQKIAYTFFQMNKDDSARQWLENAQQLAGEKGVPADAVMAQFYIGRNDLVKAKESLAAAEKKSPQSDAVLNLGIVLALHENNLDLAWTKAQALLKEHPEHPAVLKTYGSVAQFRNDYAAAEQAYQKVNLAMPADADAQNGLALSLCEQQDPEKKKRAVQYAKANVQKQNNNREFLATYGWCLYQLGQKSDAAKVLQQSAADGRMSQAGAYYFATILADSGKKEEAKKLLQTALDGKQSFAKRASAQELLNKLKAEK